MRLLNASVLPRKSPNRNPFWGFRLGTLHLERKPGDAIFEKQPLIRTTPFST